MSKSLTIVRASVLGYCMGVRRAIEIAEKTLDENSESPVYTFGPLIHNTQAIEDLMKKGIRIVGSGYNPLPDDFAGGRVVIRAHGITPAIRSDLLSRNAKIIDATCPRVSASQQQARLWHEKGYTVILAGDRNHGEMVGIAGYAPGSLVVENRAEAENLGEREGGWPERAVLLSQTTIKSSEYDQIAAVLEQHIGDLVLLKTICSATKKRQEALDELAGLVDAIVVIGGKNSANTQRLFQSACEKASHAWHIETESELPEEAFGFSRIGLTAGASTPDAVIDAVEQALQKGYYSRHESH